MADLIIEALTIHDIVPTEEELTTFIQECAPAYTKDQQQHIWRIVASKYKVALGEHEIPECVVWRGSSPN